MHIARPTHSLRTLCFLLAGSLTGLLLPAAAAQPTADHSEPDQPAVIRLATTTSTEHSGLLKWLLPVFERQSGYQVQVLAQGSGKSLRLGQQGDVDILLTHAPAAEADFVAAGYGINPRPLMHNRFLLVGPDDDPAQIRALSSASQALAAIAQHKATFISRGDDSGTHRKERQLWQDAAVRPEYSGYLSIGQGMGPALRMAAELRGYTLTDSGTWLAWQAQARTGGRPLALTVLLDGDPALHNPYQVILVNPARHQGLNATGARAFSDWLLSPGTQQLINRFRLSDQQLFFADALPRAATAATAAERATTTTTEDSD